MTVVSKATFARILTAQITAVVLQQKVLQMVVKLLPQGHTSASVKMDILVIFKWLNERNFCTLKRECVDCQVD